MSNKLSIEINSFSYKQNGIPKDNSGNGGGFVFDCRGILNPGRIDEYKTKTGQDEEVQHYLETETLMPQFLNSIQQIADISVQDYLKRGFKNLQFNFGCTGGQHRSVYGAIQLSNYLRNKYGEEIEIKITHCNQEGWVR